MFIAAISSWYWGVTIRMLTFLLGLGIMGLPKNLVFITSKLSSCSSVRGIEMDLILVCVQGEPRWLFDSFIPKFTWRNLTGIQWRTTRRSFDFLGPSLIKSHVRFSNWVQSEAVIATLQYMQSILCQ
jgi:hypothetical protein